MKEYKKICINCPAGCHLEIAVEEGGSIRVSGNNCPRGEKYAVQEITDPRRIVTAVVRSNGEDPVCIPVKSVQPVPKQRIPALLEKIFSMRIDLPVQRGQILLQENGIDIAATRSFTARND